MLLSYWTVYRSPCAIKNSQRTTRHCAALNRRVFLDYLRPNRVLLNGWHLDSLSKKANFGDDSENYFWLLSKKRPCCALEHALGFSKLSRRASEIKNWQRTTRYKIASIYFWTPCIFICLMTSSSSAPSYSSQKSKTSPVSGSNFLPSPVSSRNIHLYSCYIYIYTSRRIYFWPMILFRVTPHQTLPTAISRRDKVSSTHYYIITSLLRYSTATFARL
jgi:hypothetical protein